MRFQSTPAFYNLLSYQCACGLFLSFGYYKFASLNAFTFSFESLSSRFYPDFIPTVAWICIAIIVNKVEHILGVFCHLYACVYNVPIQAFCLLLPTIILFLLNSNNSRGGGQGSSVGRGLSSILRTCIKSEEEDQLHKVVLRCSHRHPEIGIPQPHYAHVCVHTHKNCLYDFLNFLNGFHLKILFLMYS